MIGILVGMDHKDYSRFPVVHTSTVCSDRCRVVLSAKNCGFSAVFAHRQDHQHP